MTHPVKTGVLLGVGNPLLDITVCGDTTFLQKYDLQANNAIIAGDEHMPMFDEMMRKYEPIYGAGGATQNSIRVAQWLLRTDHATTFFGCVGEDARGEILASKGTQSGVNVHYEISQKLPTGVCGAVITGEDRSLVAHLGAANFFSHAFLEKPENWELVERAEVYYIGGFVFPVCSQSIFDIAKHACANNKTLAMNLSAPFMCKYFADKKIDVMPYVDLLFGNETEAAEFCKLRGIEAKDIRDMALETSRLPKANTGRDRIVVFTQGRDPTIIARDGRVTEHPITPIQKADIRDTNGCGDSFVGGFLSQLVRGADIDECLRCGQYAASVVIKHWGCTFPDEPSYDMNDK